MATATGRGRASGVGRTGDAGSVILGAGFWQPGLTLKLNYLRSFTTRLDGGETGECHQFLLDDPKTIDVPMNNGKFDPDGKEIRTVDKVAIGALTGFTMALQSLQESTPWFASFQRGDLLTITCTGIQEPTQRGYSGMPEFEVKIDR